MATIEKRGPHQFRVKIRRLGHSVSRTFETKNEAQQWARIEEGKVSGDEYVDKRFSRRASLGEALRAYEEKGVNPSKSDAKNKRSKIAYWQSTKFASWSLSSLKAADLLGWRREVLNEDDAEDGEQAGPLAECSAQTVVHRLNVLSQVYKHWRLHHDQTISNPVIDGVRPSVQNERDRRLEKGEEKRLLAAAARSSRGWLSAAIIISIESAMRQAELAGLVWSRVQLTETGPHVYLPAKITKNKRSRRVPLSARAVEAFKSLRPKNPGGDDSVFPIETPRAIGHAWLDVVSEEEFPNLRWHDLRHEATSRFFENTALRDIEIMAITGHVRPEMLRRYAHLRTDCLAPLLDQKRK